ncbi:hypothetical protein PAAG_04769 [Paracoccidioides lutzii Pb01]|uniref:Uncharacterized protein n=1 Tax=Paracoccidioides lutzii (strain ATCC MYA-826 / Pb01) TaxID=502779 RepID=C1H2E0_PARBA|nr:hypothetical protein PAAG_04769 [Paracoccidioides lutzii Pb01]EEH33720.2 hypothetical protein PAAG_04769 [Paracoccidioides lutzii Pb01]
MQGNRASLRETFKVELSASFGGAYFSRYQFTRAGQINFDFCVGCEVVVPGQPKDRPVEADLSMHSSPLPTYDLFSNPFSFILCQEILSSSFEGLSTTQNLSCLLSDCHSTEAIFEWLGMAKAA